MSDTVIFVGPTLSAAEVSALQPDAEVRPPVAVGDVLALLRRRGLRRILIIDGYFERMAAVWHKEILLALERGITVWGAASMGALRAVELAPFGMRGCGAVYAAFWFGALGEQSLPVHAGLPPLTCEDEVAVAHLPPEAGYLPVSDALVNLRAGIAAAPMLSEAQRATLVELARKPFYRERSWARLIADARAASIPTSVLDELARWPKPDVKADDARLLLRGLRHKPRTKGAKVPRTWAFRQILGVRTVRNPRR